MIRGGTRRFFLNHVLLLAVGLWPYQQSRLVQFQIIFLFSILISFTVCQLITFVTAECTADLVIKILSSTLINITFVIHYNSFWINIRTVKHLYEQLQHIYNKLEDENEIAIIKKYGNYGRIYTIVLTLPAMLFTFIFILLSLWPRILDILSISGPRISLQLVTKYFIDEERYFYLIWLHANAALCIGIVALLATGTILIVYIQHACGMFQIASYRIEQAMTIVSLQKNNLERKNLIFRGLIYAIDMHREAMKFSDSSVSKFQIMFFFLIVVGVVCTSLSIFRIFQIVSTGHESDQILVPIAYVLIHSSYMVVGSYIAQAITDHNDHVFATVYNVEWYLAPLCIQKMILFLLQRSTKTFTLNIGGFFVGSLESAATLVSTSISYFTVLYATRQ